MIRTTSDLSLAARQGYDAIIDVRSPGEFAQDHIPGALNLPVLDDAQRAEVGTMFVQRSKFLARRIGAAYVAHNIAGHLQAALADRDGNFRPLVYCWRGGQRSAAMVTVMEQVGWPVTQLEGGYQTWRRKVVADLYDRDAPADTALKLVLLDGYTGSGKTGILRRLPQEGVQTLDLEALADHRGSLFGAPRGAQPGQKLFESRIVEALDRLDRTRPIVVEAESSRIGNLTLPPVLWAAMKAAPRIEVTVPVEARVALVLNDYRAIGADVEALEAALRRLPRHHSRETIAGWVTAAREGRLAELVTDLMLQHYDPAYRRGANARHPALATVSLNGTSERDLHAGATQVAQAVAPGPGPGQDPFQAQA
ncbi:MAG: tRNA 2-selenouridine(34) synthase MnmH [Brevundimonas sp.]|uniref:tRNA 2-selenouridine(34) synthase MnmH n=1 Tax=Brevundimonas sp. TaxID=1871086 RepID=UPI002734291A|nr:tRNA 2-selenouridine(34) synthase MnmH [Brevundimonas sp.]MDP3403179.1 tRNA 2-selenouridine(34) synthase MnmH [Brevundimonas sp.]